MIDPASDYEARLREMVDKEAIWETIRRLARGMDRHDAELIAGCYHIDAFDDHGNFRGTVPEFIAHMNGTADDPGAHARLFTDHMHILSNHLCDLDGNVAHTETYVTLVAQNRADERVSVCVARYIDRFEKRGGYWKIALRRVVMGPTAEFTSANSLALDKLPLFLRGTWDRSDISYARPLTL